MEYNRTFMMYINFKDLIINILYQTLAEVHNNLYMFKDRS